jgi:hypothetical protein
MLRAPSIVPEMARGLCSPWFHASANIKIQDLTPT